MTFDEENKVIIETMDAPECKAFIKFLKSEIYRHIQDIEQAQELIGKVREKINE